ncbi:MAG: beta-lactamase family protein, partial [Myxococcaceae bacterium]|nr:beta-lactamase family protein [Myxococcaceae bacterium]
MVKRAARLLLLLSLPAWADALPAEQVSAIDAAVRALLAQRPSAGLSIGVRHGDAEWSTGYGYAQLAPPKPASPQTSYRLASVTKTLTGVAIMQLVEQGKVSLDAEVQAYLPRFPKKQGPITVRDLLTHVSGIYHYRDPKKEGHFKRHFSTEQSLALFKDWPLAHDPGTKFLYTTYGYDVLGAIVEAASGKSYADYLRDHVFGPAGMKRSSVEDPAKRDASWAAGYRVKAGKLVPSESIDISSRFAGGGARSTVDDLLHYGAALFAGKLVKPATWEQMKVSGRTHDGRWVDYGLGFAVYPRAGHFIVAHLGGQPETTSLLILLPAHQLVIALLTNVEGQAALLSELGDVVIETLLDGGERRRPLYADDPVDQVLLDGMNRVFSYGLARREGWGGELKGNATLEETFTQLAVLLSREHIASDPDAARSAIAQAHHLVKGAV